MRGRLGIGTERVLCAHDAQILRRNAHGYPGVSRRWRGRRRSSASTGTIEAAQTTAASGQSATGATDRTSPPSAGPSTYPTSQDVEVSAMYRPRRCAGARSATSAPWVGPWKLVEKPNTTAAPAKTSAAA